MYQMQAAQFDRSKWKRKSLVTLALTFLTSSQAILIVWSKRAGKYEYSVTTANFLVEALKCALSLAALVRIWRNEGVNEDNRSIMKESGYGQWRSQNFWLGGATN